MADIHTYILWKETGSGGGKEIALWFSIFHFIFSLFWLEKLINNESRLLVDVMGWVMSPPNSRVEVLTPSTSNRSLSEIRVFVKLKWDHWVEPQSNVTDALKNKRDRNLEIDWNTGRKPHEHEDSHLWGKENGLKQIFPLKPLEEPTLLTPWS